MSVRLSCHDWTEGGNTPDDAAIFATMFKAAGADLIDCSSGQVSKEEKPVYGRLFQTPFADQIRNEVGIATIAVGAISRGRPRQFDHRRRPRRSLRASPARILPTPPGRCTRPPRSGVDDRRLAEAISVGAAQYEANLARAREPPRDERASTGRHALVTGAGGGIGAAIAARARARGRAREPRRTTAPSRCAKSPPGCPTAWRWPSTVST